MRPRKITVLGLCGRSGSGKGFVCQAFASLGVAFVDTDAVYRVIIGDVNSPCVKELVREFGNTVVNSRGVDKKALSEIVFSDNSKLERLNLVTHKYIYEATFRLVEEYEKNGADTVIIDAPVLFESGFYKFCDYCICVTCSDETCIKRITERDGIDADAAKKRLASQLPVEILRELCDFEIVNNENSRIFEQAKSIIETIGEKKNET